MKNYKWYFELVNDWDYLLHGQISMIHIDLFSVHLDKDARWVTIMGFSFIWNKIKYQKARKK